MGKKSGELLNKRGLFIKIINDLNITWKQASYFLINIVDCWKETGDIKKILEVNRFNIPIVKKIIEILESTDNIFLEMDKFQFNEKKKVAVINLYQFNEIDKKVLPPPSEYTEIKVFKEGHLKELPEFKILNGGTDLIYTLVQNIKKVNPNDVAIVLDPKSHYQSLIEAALRSNNISYLIKQKFSENEELRLVFSLIRAALNEKGIRLKEIQPILNILDIKIDIEHNEKFLTKIEIEDKAFEQFLKFLEVIPNLTFNKVFEKLETSHKKDFTVVRENLSDLNLLDKKISQKRLNQLEFYLDSFDISIESSVNGILFVSPKSVAYVDRPIVFYIGMDTSWTPEILDKPWINKEKRELINLTNFLILIQNGEHQYYLVQDKVMNEKITPCFYFNEIMGSSIDSFKDLPYTIFNTPDFEKDIVGFPKEIYTVEFNELKTISQSQLNNFLACPRYYAFSSCIKESDNFYLKRGTLYHQFAEFYRNNPEFIKQKGLEKFVALITKELASFHHEIYYKQLKTEIEIGIKIIMRYIDYGLKIGQIKDVKLKGYKKKPENENIFSKSFNKSIETTTTEMWFESPELGIKGKVDLIQAEDNIVDFKSGTKPSLSQIMKKANLEVIETKPDFQALLYLTYLRRIILDKPLRFDFNYFLNNSRDIANYSDGDIEHLDINQNLIIIKYFPCSYTEIIIREDFFDSLQRKKNTSELLAKTNAIRKVLDTSIDAAALGYSNYCDLLQKHGFNPNLDLNDIMSSPLVNDFISYIESQKGRKLAYVRNGCEQIVKRLIESRKLIYLKEDIDAFEQKIKTWINKINSYKKSKFPIGDLDLDNLEIDRSLIYRGRD